jgi:hypothetical protein
MTGRNDAEKRWHDPAGFQRAVLYVASVAACAAVVAAIVFAWFGRENGWALSIVPAAVLMCGTLGAFVRTYRVWRDGGVWPIWQGAAWFLMLITIVYIGMSSVLIVNP